MLRHGTLLARLLATPGCKGWILTRAVRQIATLGFALVTTACTQAAFLAANFPTHFDDMKVVHDVAYGPLLSQQLDIYIPVDSRGKKLDVIVFFYGGRWTNGAKEDYRFVGAAFADKDFIVVIPDYQKYPQVRFPIFVEDGAKALAWVYDNVATYHGNPERIHVAGHSAGAHIGALLAADVDYLGREGKSRSLVIHDFVGLAGPYAFTPDEPDLEDMFGPPKNYPNMRVTTFIDGKQPPMLLLYGDADKTVKYDNLERLEQQIKKKGGSVQSKIYHDVDHAGLVGALSWFNPHDAPVVQDIVSFFGSDNQIPSE
jgi:acetyl esterase/lipase